MPNIFSFISKKSYRNANNIRHYDTSPYYLHAFSLEGVSLSNCRLEYGNGVFYSQTEYDSESKARIFNDLITRDPMQLIFRNRSSANATQNFAVHAVVLYEEILKINKIVLTSWFLCKVPPK